MWTIIYRNDDGIFLVIFSFVVDLLYILHCVIAVFVEGTAFVNTGDVVSTHFAITVNVILYFFYYSYIALIFS